MKYKIKNQIDVNSLTPVSDYLKLFGITKTNSFLFHPPIEDEINPELLTGIDRAATILEKHIKLQSDIYLVVDSDADGYTSASIIYNFLVEHLGVPREKITHHIHKEKEHGVIPSLVPYGTGLVIIPDAGSEQSLELEELDQRSIDVIVLDHHHVASTYESQRVVVVNNQLSMLFDNKNLSGAGVTFKFVQHYAKKHSIDIGNQYYDIAAVGIIADMMFGGELDNNYIIQQGLRNISNKMLQALIQQQAYSLKQPVDRIGIAFYIAPLINGVVRFATQELKHKLFLCMANNDLTEEVINENTGEVETIYEYTARESYNAKNRQAKHLEKALIKAKEYIEEQELHNNQAIIIKTDELNDFEIKPTLTGLLANQIAAIYKRPTLVLRRMTIDDVDQYKGSGRGFGPLESFKDSIIETKQATFAAGHGNAFGVGVLTNKVKNLQDALNENLKDVNFGEMVLDVCAEFKQIGFEEKRFLQNFADCTHIFGNGIPQPQFYFKTVVHKDAIRWVGKKSNTINIDFSSLKIIKFHSDKLKEQINNIKSSFVEITAVGSVSINEFRGIRNIQVMLQNENSIEVEEFLPQSIF